MPKGLTHKVSVYPIKALGAGRQETHGKGEGSVMINQTDGPGSIVMGLTQRHKAY